MLSPLRSWFFSNFWHFSCLRWLFLICKHSRQKYIKLQKLCSAISLQHSKSQGNRLATMTCGLRHRDSQKGSRDHHCERVVCWISPRRLSLEVLGGERWCAEALSITSQAARLTLLVKFTAIYTQKFSHETMKFVIDLTSTIDTYIMPTNQNERSSFSLVMDLWFGWQTF